MIIKEEHIVQYEATSSVLSQTPWNRGASKGPAHLFDEHFQSMLGLRDQLCLLGKANTAGITCHVEQFQTSLQTKQSVCS